MSKEEFSNHVALITDLLVEREMGRGAQSKLQFPQLSVWQLCLGAGSSGGCGSTTHAGVGPVFIGKVNNNFVLL